MYILKFLSEFYKTGINALILLSLIPVKNAMTVEMLKFGRNVRFSDVCNLSSLNAYFIDVFEFFNLFDCEWQCGVLHYKLNVIDN